MLALPGVARALRELHLNQNFITPEGAAALGAALEALRALRTLRASANPIGPRGCEALVAGATRPPSPPPLVLSGHAASLSPH